MTLSIRLSFFYAFIIMMSTVQHSVCFQRRIAISRRPLTMPPIACTANADSEMNWDPKSGPKLDFNEDYYSVLDVDSKVDAKDLKKAYYKLVFKFHPDNIENESSKSMCNKQMMVINGAYRILKNIDLRVLYDRQRQKGLVGLAAGIKESSAKAAGSTGSPTEKTRPKEAETKESPPRSTQDNASRGKKYSGSGFGGSWTASDENTEAEDEVEQEYLDQERERERQRQRYQEPQPQPQTQRERDQQVRDRDREFDFTYKQDGVFETPNRTPWGFNTNTYDEPVRPTDRYREDINDLNNVEDFLRRTGSGSSDMYDSNVTGLKAKLDALCARKVAKEREMDRMSASVKDWGEVTDVRLIRKRIEDINELNSLTTQVSDLADEVADLMLRSRTPPRDRERERDGPSRSQGGSWQESRSYRPPVDLWGDTPSPRSQPPRTATRPPTRTVDPPRPATKRSPEPGSINWDAKRNIKGADQFEYNFDEDTMDQYDEGEVKESGESAWRKSRRNPKAESGSSGQAFASFLFEDEKEEADADEEDEGADGNAVLKELLRVFKEKNKRKK